MCKINNKKKLVRMKKSFILDPLWITKGTYLDSEYVTYVLLDASIKYKKEIEKDNIDRFYEVLFHSLNLNNLAVHGTIFTPKFKIVWNDPKLLQIQDDLTRINELPKNTSEIFKNANFAFLNILLEYTNVHLDILEKIRLFYINQKIHMENEIFIVTNIAESNEYTIWKLKEDNTKNLGISFTKIRTVILETIKENILQEELDKLGDPKLETMKGSKNIFFAVIEEEEDPDLVAKTIKDLILLNKGLAQNHSFETSLIGQLHNMMWVEKIMPFTLNQWKFENAKDV